jgi:hypothetical protein
MLGIAAARAGIDAGGQAMTKQHLGSSFKLQNS